MSWIVRDGQTIRIWKDQWLPQGTLRSYIEGPIFFQDGDQRVSSLRAHHTWNFDAFNFPLPPPSASEPYSGYSYRTIHATPRHTSFPHNNGTCSVKSASKFLYHKQNVPFNAPGWKWIWALIYLKKIQTFIWKAMRDRLPTQTFLTIGRPYLDANCPRCHYPETIIHIL